MKSILIIGMGKFGHHLCQNLVDLGNEVMIVDTNLTQKDFGVIVKDLEQLGENIGVIIKCQKEEIFNQMHRI